MTVYEALKTTDANTELPLELLKLLQSCRTLPSIPAVAVQVLDLANDIGAVGALDLAKVVARDPAMVARIMKVANSIRYGVSHEISTVEQAISLLGLTETMNLALSFSLTRELKSKKGSIFDHQQYWKRSVMSALAATEIGLMFQAAPKDELFLTGILQDIGMLALNEALPGYGRLSASSLNDHFRLVEIERRELQTDHAAVGAWLLHRWGLPERMVSAIRNNHVHEKSDNLLANAVALGSCIADIWINAESVATLETATGAADMLFSMDQKQLDHVLVKTAESFPEMVADLDMGAIDEFEINKLLDQSRSALAEINVQMLREARKIMAQAQRDSLTMLYNRAYMEQNFDNQFALSVNNGQPLTVIFIDVDNFKKINDTYGHASGDIVLIAVARTIQTAIRNYDIAVRYGGDEFIALLANAPQDVALYVSERIRSMVAEQTFMLEEGVEIRATVSIGYATLTSDSGIKTSMELLETADKKLYCAKSAGRNCVV